MYTNILILSILYVQSIDENISCLVPGLNSSLAYDFLFACTDRHPRDYMTYTIN